MTYLFKAMEILRCYRLSHIVFKGNASLPESRITHNTNVDYHSICKKIILSFIIKFFYLPCAVIGQ